MKRTSICLVLAALTAAAPGCDRKATSSASATASAITSAVERAVDPPPNPYVPASTPLPHHEATSVHVPHDGDSSAARTLKAKYVAGGSPAPRAPTARAPLPKTHAGDAKPWACLDHDECYFPRMPFYSQTNPNLAHVKLPKKSYDADTSKLTGPIVWDAATKSHALVLDPTGGKTKDPFYNTWLPYGPVSDKDEGYIGYWYSALCGATAEAMAVMASYAAKSPGTKPKPGSWMDTALVEARRPEAQAALPEPLLRDHTSLAPDQRQMTDKDVQRVINMAVKEGTSPVSGGGDGVMTSLADEFEPVRGKSPVETRQDAGKLTTNQVLMDAVRDRFAPVINIQEYKASLKPVSQGGKLVKYALTFTNTGGHFLAVNGFAAKAKKRARLLIYDPVYANPVHKTIASVALAGATKDGVPIEVTAPDPRYATHLPILDDLDVAHEEGDAGAADAPKEIRGIADIADGADVTLVGGYSAIKIE